ncbi:MAG: response regulator [Nitrospirae bacterium]|nr:response regulator [Nitrospirota bacterium]
MNRLIRRIFNSLTFRTIAPIVAIALLAWIGLYVFVLRSVSRFVDDQIQGSFVELSHDIYTICDSEFKQLVNTGSLSQEEAVRIRKAVALGSIDDFMRQNNLKGSVVSQGKTLLMTENTTGAFMQSAEAAHSTTSFYSFTSGDRSYFAYHINFDPWAWNIIIVRDRAEYSAIVSKVRIAYGVTGAILTIATLLFIFTFRKNIREPLDELLTPVREGRRPDYRGITEFEYLSRNIRNAMDLHEKEALFLNNIYHISVVKRGEDFFDEVTMAIARLFDLNASISRLDPDGRTERIISLYLQGSIKKNFTIDLKGTPCEDIVTGKHIYVENTGIHNRFPHVRAFADTKAEAYIGMGIFNRKGEVIGIINAFGKEREFSDSDVKVLQTIGELVASEFERIDEEKEKEQMREQLFQAHKMEAIGTLAGGIAHDFNNMLQGILGHASLIKAQMPRGHELYDSVDTIEHIAERAAQLTKQLLGFARKGKYLNEPLAINEVVRNVLKIISKTFDRKIEIVTDLADDMLIIEGDRSQIEQVIMNLCLNARDAMPHGGKLVIRTHTGRNIPGDPTQTVAAGTTDTVVIEISDTGFGISDDVKDRIFEPFFTTKELGKGTGMGLAMVYGVVTNHHGTITVRSSAERGTAFIITLPAYAYGLPEDDDAAQPLLQGKGTILVVDDEEFIRGILKSILEKLGYNVILASNGREALDIYARQKDHIDLVILDLIMPVMNGREAYEQLVHMNRDIRIIIASGHMTAGQAAFIKDKTRHAFLQKPFKMHDIATNVKALLSV